MGEKKYRDKDWLLTEYKHKCRGATDIAEECNVATSTIYTWLEKNGIETRSIKQANKERFGTTKSKHNDVEWLAKKYLDEGMTASAISDICGVHKSTIIDSIERSNIPKKSHLRAVQDAERQDNSGRDNPYWNEYACFSVDTSGYETWQHRYQNERHTVMVHRLLAVAMYGFEEIKGKEIHHKSNVPWDNRPENIELLSSSEHSKLHGLMKDTLACNR
jgi:transposase